MAGSTPSLTPNATPSLACAERDAEPRVSFTVRGPTRIPAGELREAELSWYSVGERGGPDGQALDGDFHLRAEARIRAGLRRPVPLPKGGEVRAALDDEDAALATLTSLFEPGYLLRRALKVRGTRTDRAVQRRLDTPMGAS
jgi:hypothetical protein